MENRIEDIFLTYVNAPLTRSPESLSLVFDACKFNLSFAEDQRKEISAIIEQISKVCSLGPIAAKKNLQRTKPKASLAALRVAYLATYGWKEKKGKCGICYPISDAPRQTYLKEYLVNKREERKCFECDQLFFKYMLAELVKCTEYSQICSNALGNLFLNAYTPFDNAVIWMRNPSLQWKPKQKTIRPRSAAISEVPVTPTKTSFKEQLAKRSYWNFERAFQVEEGYEVKRVSSGFNRNVMDLVGYSLAEFLLVNDRRTMKICDGCKKFFVAKKLDNRIKKCENCSRKSTMQKDERRLYQQKYRAKKKNERDDQKREQGIKRIMDAGYTREEAIEMIEADSQV